VLRHPFLADDSHVAWLNDLMQKSKLVIKYSQRFSDLLSRLGAHDQMPASLIFFHIKMLDDNLQHDRVIKKMLKQPDSQYIES
jgi:hypothetical protein